MLRQQYPPLMSIRLRIDHRKLMVSTRFSGEISLSAFGRYAREFTHIPISKTPYLHFADTTAVTKLTFSMEQMMPHAEQMVARLAHGQDIAAGIILAPSPVVLPHAQRFRDIAADSFPIEVYSDTDRALDRLGSLLAVQPKKRRVPNRPLSAAGR